MPCGPFVNLPAPYAERLPRDMPPELVSFLESLEVWAHGNEKDAKADEKRYWSLKIPSLLLTASSGIAALASYRTYIIATISALGTIFVGLDTILKPGRLRGVHMVAFHDIRSLQDSIVSQWTTGRLAGKDPNALAAELIKLAQNQTASLAANLKKEEARGL